MLILTSTCSSAALDCVQLQNMRVTAAGVALNTRSAALTAKTALVGIGEQQIGAPLFSRITSNTPRTIKHVPRYDVRIRNIFTFAAGCGPVPDRVLRLQTSSEWKRVHLAYAFHPERALATAGGASLQTGVVSPSGTGRAVGWDLTCCAGAGLPRAVYAR